MRTATTIDEAEVQRLFARAADTTVDVQGRLEALSKLREGLAVAIEEDALDAIAEATR